MKRLYVLLSLILMQVLVCGMKSKSDIHLVFPPEYADFSEAFSSLFQNESDIWLILGNRGAKNLYRERFSSHWFYWDLMVSEKVLGVSGDACVLDNWEAVYKYFPKKIKYIAVDFNGLINHRKRNDILKAASKVLSKGGIFCLEDDFLSGINRLKHFSDKDLEELSKTFDIKFTYCDGFISSLPYTCDTSMNGRNNLYKGLERMVLRLAAANDEEKKQLMPYISNKLIKITKNLSREFIADLVNSILHSSLLDKLITEYQSLLEQKKAYSDNLSKEVEKLNKLQPEIENYQKLQELSDKTRGKLKHLADQASQTLSKFKSIAFGSKAVSEKTQKKKKSGGMFSSFSPLGGENDDDNSKKKDEGKDMLTVLNEKLAELDQVKLNIASLESKVQVTNVNLEALKKQILEYEDQVFKQFAKDKFLNRYGKYQKKDLDRIIESSAEINQKFMIDYDSNSWWLSKMEIIAKELENSWSPEVILTNLVTLDELKALGNAPSVQRVLVILVNKKAVPIYQAPKPPAEEKSKENPAAVQTSDNSSEKELRESEERLKKISEEEADREKKGRQGIEEMIAKSKAEVSELRKYLSTLEQNKKDAESGLKNSEPKIVNSSISDHVKFLDSEITKMNARIKEIAQQNSEKLKEKYKTELEELDKYKKSLQELETNTKSISKKSGIEKDVLLSAENHLKFLAGEISKINNRLQEINGEIEGLDPSTTSSKNESKESGSGKAEPADSKEDKSDDETEADESKNTDNIEESKEDKSDEKDSEDEQKTSNADDSEKEESDGKDSEDEQKTSNANESEKSSDE